MAVADKVTVELEARTGQYEANVKRAGATFDRALNQNARTAEIAERRIRASQDSIRSGLTAVAGVIAATAVTGQIVRIADEYTTLQNRLRSAGLEGQALADVQDRLYAGANRNGVAINDLAQLYSRVSISSGELGANQEELLRFTDGVAASLRVQGVSAQQAAGPLLQLGQSLGSTVVRAEEFNSLIEGTPVLVQAAARGMGISVSELREKILEGEVTNRAYFAAFLKGFPEVEAQAQKSTQTVSQALTVLNNELGRYVGQTDESLSATQRLAGGIVGLANNLDVIIPAVTVLATLIATRYTAAMITATFEAGRLAVANATLGSSMLALVGGPVGVTILAVAGLTAGLGYLSTRAGTSEELLRDLGSTSARTSTALENYRKAATDAANASGKNANAARQNAEAMRIEAVRALRSAAALRIRTAALAAETAALAEQANVNASRGVGNPYAPGFEQGGADIRSRNATAAANRAAADERRARAELAQIEKDYASGALRERPVAPGGGDSGPSRTARASGPSEADLAATRQQLALESEIARLRAEGNEDAARGLQRMADIAALEKQLSDAQVADARRIAEERIDAVYEAEDVQREIDRNLEQSAKRNERRLAARERENEILRQNLDVELAIARASGDETRIQNLEREIALLERRAQYGIGREGEAAIDQGRINSAEDATRERDKYREYAGEFIDALQSGDIWGSLGERFAAAAADRLQDVLGSILQAIFSSQNGQPSIASNVLGSLGSAVFGGLGRRANGGPTSPGGSYLIGDRTGDPRNFEVFRPGVAGSITPLKNMGGGKSITIKNGDIIIQGGADGPALRAYVDRAVAIGNARTVQAVRAAAPGVQLERQLLVE